MLQNNMSKRAFYALIFCHIMLLTASNLLVQYPFNVLGFQTTWGAFSYPIIFILTDLTTRLSTAKNARKIIFSSMLPGLLISYVVASWIEGSDRFYWHDLFSIHIMPLRIALACFVAYVMGQLFDVFVFQRYRNEYYWWSAPILSTTAGNVLDTLLFFTIAFYHCNNPFLSQHWAEIAMVDIFFKILISLIAFVPLYRFVLKIFNKRHLKQLFA